MTTPISPELAGRRVTLVRNDSERREGVVRDADLHGNKGTAFITLVKDNGDTRRYNFGSAGTNILSYHIDGVA